jgi:CheY-like chemotaxis protein
MESISSSKLAESLMSVTKSFLGPRVFDAFSKRMTDEYLGGEMSAYSAIVQRPELFERAFIGMLGQGAGEAILGQICKQAASELGFQDAIATTYSRKGDFAIFVATATGSQAETIVIIDDDMDILAGMKELLVTCGFSKIETFNDPIEALERFRAAYYHNNNNEKGGDQHNILVLTDIRMPRMDGLLLAKELRNINPDVKILPMTAYQLDAEMKDHLSEVTTENLLQKPFGVEELCVAVRKATPAPRY